MTVRLVFLGPLRDLVGEPECLFPSPLDWAGLLSAIEPAVAERLIDDRTRVAINGTLLANKATLLARAGDEVALLPPVSGG